ncbi:hypothetical protein D3C87_2152510 [compost metagenome]
MGTEELPDADDPIIDDPGNEDPGSQIEREEPPAGPPDSPPQPPPDPRLPDEEDDPPGP